MSTSSGVTTLFLDIGGVLLSNGWDRQMRRRAAQHFMLDYEELNERHHLTFDSYEKGLLNLEGYLERVVFYEERTFTREEFKTFMFDQSQPFPEMITLVRRLKARYPLKIVAVSNEGRELNGHRIHRFALAEIIDFFVSSCYVHLRKPDPDIFLMALDMAQVLPQQVVYFDDRQMFVDIAGELGIRSVVHESYESTRSALADLGFTLD
jgi:putative hydrolase of the HAD superfamily